LQPAPVSVPCFELSVYKDSQNRIGHLRKKLPSELVAGLAQEVIRRLGSRDTDVTKAALTPRPKEIEQLCFALISADDTAAPELIIGLRAEGTSAKDIYLQYLSVAARKLGDWWCEDKINFMQVTIGTGRMFSIMRGMRHLFTPSAILDNRCAIFASVPGEDHTLGVRMASDIFRQDGWDISLKVGLDHDELVADIERAPNGLVGLSIGGQHSLPALSKLIVALRLCCPHSNIFVCGQDIDAIKDLLSLMALDGIADDVEEAKTLMSDLWNRMSSD
jgi:MerR family transcriptional regulator, light-induced transcriptional regulator